MIYAQSDTMSNNVEITILNDGSLLISDENPEMATTLLKDDTDREALEEFLGRRAEVLMGESTLCG